MVGGEVKDRFSSGSKSGGNCKSGLRSDISIELIDSHLTKLNYFFLMFRSDFCMQLIDPDLSPLNETEMIITALHKGVLPVSFPVDLLLT